MKKKLITSALPYVNNIPHLGNLIQVLSGDVFARFCRLRGYETLYICGTDEYGTATETRALEEGISPQELCDRYYKVHANIYEWFNIAFDKFGRTSTPNHTKITQSIFLGLDKNGFIQPRTISQLYCEKCQMFLADRYVRGKCPHCGYDEARGDQCENCGKLLDPTDLIDPQCGTCGSSPVVRQTDHLYIDLPAILPKLEAWLSEAKEGGWARNAVQMTQAWIRDGLKERCITRDLRWGIPVPKEGYTEKVFYVWFDAPIGYISITANLTDEWESWWKNKDEVNLYQFVGKDNIPFHTVVFPSSLLGSGEEWTMLHHMSSSEFLNYESGKFSKSKGIGVFGNDAQDSGIPADVWRFYIYYNRPERSDAVFTWADFQEKVNGELIGNLSNLVNRTLTFVAKNLGGDLPEGSEQSENSVAFWEQARRLETEITNCLERVELREAFRIIFQLSSLGNKRFQDEEPWRTIKESPDQAGALLADLVYLLRDLSILIRPYLPTTSDRIAEMVGSQKTEWTDLTVREGIGHIARPELLFSRLEDDQIEAFRKRFAGSQSDRNKSENAFRNNIDLRIARIEKVEKHPKADKLYIETIDLGGEKRQIVSGLVPYYQTEELEGRNVLLVYNLAPAKLRGVESQGMLLAAQAGDDVEVIFADEAAPGDRVVFDGDDEGSYADHSEISIDDFFKVPIKVSDFYLTTAGRKLVVAGRPLKTIEHESGEVR